MARLLSPAVLSAALPEEIPAGSEIVEGAPRARHVELDPVAGLWEMSPGVARDVEQDEIFLVVAGRGRLQVEDGQTIELEPGVLVRLGSGNRTTWTVTETLRKVYVAQGDTSDVVPQR